MPGDPYLVLEVSRDATGAEIKAAYRRLAALHHPDRNPGFQDAANEKLKELNAAYEAIKRGGFAATGAEDRDEAPPARPDDPPPARPDDPPPPRPDHHSMIAAELALMGFLADADETDDLTVEVLASLIPEGTEIAFCVGFDSFEVSEDYDFRELHRSTSRIADLPDMSTMPSLAAGARPTVVRGEVVVCAGDSFVWTTRRIALADSVWEEVTVTAYAFAFSEILGAETAGRRKDKLKVWIDEGPTLTFGIGRSNAERLSQYVDLTAASY